MAEHRVVIRLTATKESMDKGVGHMMRSLGQEFGERLERNFGEEYGVKFISAYTVTDPEEGGPV